jgi:imidazolonepropionase-like amidohydrolase
MGKRATGMRDPWFPALATAGVLAACAAPGSERGRRGFESTDELPAPPTIRPLEPGESGFVVHCGKLLTLDEKARVLSPGMIVVRGRKIEAVGRELKVPEGFVRIDAPKGWVCPGFVDLHTHIHAGGFADINDSVFPINAELRTSPSIRPGNPALQRAVAGGVTTLFGIPGSGSSVSGFGVLYKSKGPRASYADCVVADPGGMKVAQAYNPQRSAGDFGSTWAGLGWILEDANDRAVAALRQDRADPALENLKKVHAKELPVLIHTAGSDGVSNTIRMWQDHYDVRSILSHGCFDGWKVAEYLGRSGMVANNGPRIIDYLSAREGTFTGYTAEYIEHGAKDVSLNTDSPIVPQEELSLQGAMAARYGAPAYLMLEGITAAPARSIGAAHRLGSLEAGKDADLLLFSGDPLDPRSRIDWVMIDGAIEYDRVRDGQRF